MDSILNATLNATAAVRALPPEAPLEMPAQSLRAAPQSRGRPTTEPRLIGLRRLLVIGGATAMAMEGTYQMYRVLAVNGPTPIALIMVALFLALFAWIALSFTSALAGFFSLLAGGGRRLLASDLAVPATRTALLMPTYNESPCRVMAELQAIWESLQAAGSAGESFDIFILSDTTEADTWIEEEAAYLTLCARTGGKGRIFYRHRQHNTARKAGNIADWVVRFGGAYPQFLILDADSVMAADTLIHLVNAMERHSGVGLIQTLPIVTGGSTLFARLQQFAGRVYGPLIAHGIAWWHGAEGNYWGHNALIRTQAFAGAAGLPELAGRKPFGGLILSHDFVEAALLRRAGWAMHMVPALPGSYEECPPITDRPRHPRPPLVPGQHAARRGAADSRAALDQPAAPADRHRLLHHRAALAAVPAQRHCHRGAGALRATGLFPSRPLAVSALACHRSGARHVDVRRHHGRIAAAQTTRRHRNASHRSPRSRRRVAVARKRAGGKRAGRADRAGRDADANAARRDHSVRPRFRMERAAPR